MLIASRFLENPYIGGAEPVDIICDKFCCVVFNAPGFEHIFGREFFGVFDYSLSVVVNNKRADQLF